MRQSSYHDFYQLTFGNHTPNSICTKNFPLNKVGIIFLDQIAAVLPVELAVGTAVQVVEAAGGEFGVGFVALVGNVQGLDDGEQELVLFF